MKYESWGKISVYNNEIKKKKKAFENQKNLQKKKPSQRPKSHTLLILPFSFHLHLHWRILRWSLIQTQFRHRSSSCLLELRLNIINKLHSQIKRYRMELCSRYTYYTGCILYIFHLLDTGMEMAINEDTMLVCPPPPFLRRLNPKGPSRPSFRLYALKSRFEFTQNSMGGGGLRHILERTSTL